MCPSLAHEEARVYARGLRHVQMEAVWGGKEDTAGALRGHCALALVSCRDMPDMEMLSHLLESLTDIDKTVRVAAALVTLPASLEATTRKDPAASEAAGAV